MRRLCSLAVLIAVVLVGLGSPRAWVEVGTQEATPAPVLTEDITVASTDLGIVDALPAAPALTVFYRLEFPPGASLSYEPGDPGLGLWVIESGALTLRNFSGDIRVSRTADPATPGTQVSEILPAGTET